jgi:hypothetical protein
VGSKYPLMYHPFNVTLVQQINVLYRFNCRSTETDGRKILFFAPFNFQYSSLSNDTVVSKYTKKEIDEFVFFCFRQSYVFKFHLQ